MGSNSGVGGFFRFGTTPHLMRLDLMPIRKTQLLGVRLFLVLLLGFSQAAGAATQFPDRARLEQNTDDCCLGAGRGLEKSAGHRRGRFLE